MKAGDKLICIKDLYDICNKNHIYKILEISEYEIQVSVNKNNNNIISVSFSLNFNLKETDIITDYLKNLCKFTDYFITEKDYRKQKIQKLNETRI